MNVAVNYRLKEDDIAYIFKHADAEVIVVDEEYVGLLGKFREENPGVRFIVDSDYGGGGEFDEVVEEGLRIDEELGGKGWSGLHASCENDEDMLALAYTSVSVFV